MLGTLTHSTGIQRRGSTTTVRAISTSFSQDIRIIIPQTPQYCVVGKLPGKKIVESDKAEAFDANLRPEHPNKSCARPTFPYLPSPAEVRTSVNPTEAEAHVTQSQTPLTNTSRFYIPWQIAKDHLSHVPNASLQEQPPRFSHPATRIHFESTKDSPKRINQLPSSYEHIAT